MEDSVSKLELEGMIPLINVHDDGIYRTLEILRFFQDNDNVPWIDRANIVRHSWNRQFDEYEAYVGDRRVQGVRIALNVFMVQLMLTGALW